MRGLRGPDAFTLSESSLPRSLRIERDPSVASGMDDSINSHDARVRAGVIGPELEPRCDGVEFMVRDESSCGECKEIVDLASAGNRFAGGDVMWRYLQEVELCLQSLAFRLEIAPELSLAGSGSASIRPHLRTDRSLDNIEHRAGALAGSGISKRFSGVDLAAQACLDATTRRFELPCHVPSQGTRIGGTQHDVGAVGRPSPPREILDGDLALVYRHDAPDDRSDRVPHEAHVDGVTDVWTELGRRQPRPG